MQEGQQALGLAGRGRRDAQVGGGKGRVVGNLRQQGRGQVAVESDGSGMGIGGASQCPVVQRRENPVSGGFERMGVGDGRHQPARAFDGHVLIGRQLGRAPDMGCVEAACGAEHQQFLARGVAAHGAEQGRAQAEMREAERDVERDTARAAGDAAGHVGAGPHGAGGTTDDVPEDRADAEDVGRARHGDICTARTGEGKRFAEGGDAA